MKRSALRKVSKRRSIELREYAKLKAETLPGKYCEFPAGLIQCYYPATQVHHSKGRRGKLLNDKRYWILLCMDCHRWAEDHKREARQLGLILYK